MQSALEVRRLSEVLGVEIMGVDLRKLLASGLQGQLRRLLDEHQFLLFRHQELSAKDQIRVMTTFGPVCDEAGDGSSVTFVSNVRPDGLFGDWPLEFHCDWSFTRWLPPVQSLYGLDVEGEAFMPTLFASNINAVSRLPEALRAGIEGRQVVHADDFTKERIEYYGPKVKLLTLPSIPPESSHPRETHPMLKPHPRTGKSMLFATRAHASHVVGLDAKSSDELLEDVFRVLYAPDNMYAHCWSRGDLGIWDNFALQHGRMGPEGIGKRRTLRRVVVNEKSLEELLAGTIGKAYKGSISSRKTNAVGGGGVGI